jgi:hypothetical protein
VTAFEDTIASAKQKVAGAVDGLADDLEALSHRIHDNPELCFKEEKAHASARRVFESTAPRSSAPSAAPDGVPGDDQRVRRRAHHRHPGRIRRALPSIGHACGQRHRDSRCAGAALAVALGRIPRSRAASR